MPGMLNWLVERSKETSTRVTVIALLGTALGAKFSPEYQEAIYMAGVAILGLIGVITKERKAKK